MELYQSWRVDYSKKAYSAEQIHRCHIILFRLRLLRGARRVLKKKLSQLSKYSVAISFYLVFRLLRSVTGRSASSTQKSLVG